MAQHSRSAPGFLPRTVKLGVTLLALASPLSACTGPGTPSVAAALACTSFQGRQGGGSEYLQCLRMHGPEAAAYRSLG